MSEDIEKPRNKKPCVKSCKVSKKTYGPRHDHAAVVVVRQSPLR